MKPKLKKGDVVEIIWQDTNIPESPGWMTEVEHEEWVNNLGDLVRSVGIYIGRKKGFINLVGDIDADDVDKKSILRPINVGTGFIKEIYVLKRAK
jgi:hypothetical protein